VILFDKDEDFEKNKEQCNELGIKVHMFDEIIEAGR